MRYNDLVEIDSNLFFLEPKYFQQGLTNEKRMFLRKKAYNALLTARDKLPLQMTFKIWDSYRTLETQKKLFDIYKEKFRKEKLELTEEDLIKYTSQYVIFPSDDSNNMSPHLTGNTVDLTIVHKELGELNMGTDFDEMCEEASLYFFREKKNKSLRDKLIMDNRELLRKAMTSSGFKEYIHEWWHYQYFGHK
ncbi:MAG: M15 family metallopeptidase [Nanoarchaeota archaeon]